MANFNQGTSVTLTAVAASGFGFNGWSGDCSGTSACTIPIDGSKSVSADFIGVKTTAAPFLAVAPSPFDFGTIQTGTTSTKTVQITNTGPSNGGNLLITSAAADNPLFGVPSTQFPITIAPGSSAPLTITFGPQANGTATGAVSFTSNGSNTSDTLQVSGTGGTTTLTGALNISPTNLYFGNVDIGTTVTQTILMSNPGTGSTTVFATTLTGSGFTVSSPAFPITIAPGGVQNVVISFTPQLSGPITSVITFTSNASSSPVVSLIASGNSSSPITAAAVSPQTLDFGAVPLGSAYVSTVVIYNTGNTDLSVTGATVTGSGFTVNTSALPITIPVNSSQAFLVQFAPVAPGASGGTVTFLTNASAGNPSVNLQATGVYATTHTATLSWAASNSKVLGYNVYRSASSGTGYQKLGFTTLKTFTDATVVSGTTYYYVVTAVGTSGTESTASNQAIATIP
ncbi:MAG: choice-of-anchor D domain-containing protein [Terriglobales bacterium]